MTTNTTVSKKINNGPSISGIVDAFKYAYDKERCLFATFTTPERPIDLKIVSMEYEDGSGEKFNLKGYVSIKYEISRGGIRLKRKNTNVCVNIFYNARSRSGHVIFNNIDDYNNSF